MIINPKDSRWSDYYFNKIMNLPEETSLTLPNSKEEVIKYLKLWNRTPLNNGSTIDIVDYEALIYYEITYKDDEMIQNLIQILKEKIAYNYKIKALLIDNLIDKDILDDVIQMPTNLSKKYGVY